MHQTVIIADDAQFMRVILKDLLEDLGYDVVAEAADGDQVVQRYRDLHPDLVLIDITMPGRDGVAACRDILAHDPEARVVMISALGQKDEVLAAVRTGAVDFVIKPFEAERVEETLRQVMARQPVAG